MDTSVDDILTRLREGNERFATGTPLHRGTDPGRRTEVARGQHPIATVLTCSDSRVPTELVFDQGLGDLFTVRTAGGIVDDVVLATVRFGVLNLGTPVVLVLGHSSCGAVTAARDLAVSGEAGSGGAGPLAALTDRIVPAIAARAATAPADLDGMIDDNARTVAERLAADLARARVVTGFYDLVSGVVRLDG